jgi:hypothetical protein
MGVANTECKQCMIYSTHVVDVEYPKKVSLLVIPTFYFSLCSSLLFFLLLHSCGFCLSSASSSPLTPPSRFSILSRLLFFSLFCLLPFSLFSLLSLLSYLSSLLYFLLLSIISCPSSSFTHCQFYLGRSPIL